MIGDVNLFMKGAPADEDFEAEAEIMIAGASSLPRSSNHSGHVSLTLGCLGILRRAILLFCIFACAQSLRIGGAASRTPPCK